MRAQPRAVSVVLAGLFASTAMAVPQTVGQALIDRPAIDSAVGSMFFLDAPAPQGQAATWGFFNDNPALAGRRITPLVFQAVGNEQRLAGVGTTRTNAATGAQSFAFDLVAGSTATGLGMLLGWKDGSNGSDNAGVAEFTNAGPGVVVWEGPGRTNFAVGDGFTPNPSLNTFARTYSFQMTVDADHGAALVGNALRDRPANDTAGGSIFILNQPIAATGPLTRWAIFDNDATADPVNRSITPLLLKPNGAQWEIVGIGATRQSNEGGAQYFDFDLVSGSDMIEPGVHLGWKDGTIGLNNQGVADYNDNAPGGPGIIWLGANRTNFAVGNLLGETGRFNRTYSIQAVASPEPGSAMLAAAGLAALALRRGKRAP